MIRTDRTVLGLISRDYVSFGLKDEKGRALGARVIKRNVEFTAMADDDRRSYYTRAPGRYVEVVVHAVRAAKDFGSSQESKHFATEAEADAYIERRVRETRARYAKKFAA